MAANTTKPDKMGTCIVLSRAMRAEIQTHCERKGQSFGEITRQALAMYLKTQKEQEEQAA